MRITQVRFSGQKDDTLSLWFMNGKFFCFVVEDEYREVKVPGETCIPADVYEIDLVKYGRFHELNQKLFGFTDGAIRIKNVRGFTGIRVHWGTDESHTDGCPIVGMAVESNAEKNGRVLRSREAYKKIYPVIRDAFLSGEKIEIEITDDISNYLKK